MTIEHNPLSGQIEQRIRNALQRCTTVEEIEVNLIADSVRKLIDPSDAAPPLVAYASTMHIRERVRHTLRKEYDPVARAQEYSAGQSEDLFSGQLQHRYPSTKRGVYVLRDQMAPEDVRYNVNRMRKGGESILQHADALEAWQASRPR